MLLWEKYKLDNKTTDDLIKDVFASPHKVIDDFVEEIKKDKDQLILKNVLFDLSTSMENLIIKKFITPSDAAPSLKERIKKKIHKEMEKFRDFTKIEKSMEDAFEEALMQFVKDYGSIMGKYIHDTQLVNELYRIGEGEEIEDPRSFYLRILPLFSNPQFKRELESYDSKSLRILEAIKILAEVLGFEKNGSFNPFQDKLREENHRKTKIHTN